MTHPRLTPAVAAYFAAAFALASFAASQVRSTRVDFTSQPEGAEVVVDGRPGGVTPLTVYDLAPGRHRAQFLLKDHEPYDAFFTIAEGAAYMVNHASLSPVKGLLLVTTDPAGADLSLDGLSLGETPRLVTTLDASGTYQLVLQKPGYKSRKMEVKFNGRTPLVRHEKLLLDSGVLHVTSDPPGAQVMVNGIVRGVAPLDVQDVPKGRATIVVSMPGYRSETRELTLNAGDSQQVDVRLAGEPGTIFLSSVPEGARFYLDGEARGKGPLSIAGLQPGTYRVKAEMEGYASEERNIAVGRGREVREEFRLASVRGRLEVKTSPAGAQVSVDGHVVGTTKQDGLMSDYSETLMVENMDVGEHTLVIKKDGYAEIVRHPVIENSRTAQVRVAMKRVFKPDVELVTANGTYRGVFVERSADAITIEVSMGITRSFPMLDVKQVNFLDGR